MHAWEWLRSARTSGIDGIFVAQDTGDWRARRFTLTVPTVLVGALPSYGPNREREFYSIHQRELSEYWLQGMFLASLAMQHCVVSLLSLHRDLSVKVGIDEITVIVPSVDNWAEIEPMVLEVLVWRLFQGRKVCIDRTGVLEHTQEWVPYAVQKTFDMVNHQHDFVRVWARSLTERTFGLRNPLIRRRENERKFTCADCTSKLGGWYWESFFRDTSTREAVVAILRLPGVVAVRVEGRSAHVEVISAVTWKSVEPEILRIFKTGIYRNGGVPVIRTPGFDSMVGEEE